MVTKDRVSRNDKRRGTLQLTRKHHHQSSRSGGSRGLTKATMTNYVGEPLRWSRMIKPHVAIAISMQINEMHKVSSASIPC